MAIVVLLDALHARPANLLVRLAATFEAAITITKGDTRADAKQILDVLSLGARKGDSVEFAAEGRDAEAALGALVALAGSCFACDLVPEEGEGGASGVAVGRAFVIESAEGATREPGTPAEEGARLAAATERVKEDIDRLLALLPERERALFQPSLLLLPELSAAARRAVDGGACAEEAVRRATDDPKVDLVTDIRALLLDALEGGGLFAGLAGSGTDAQVLVTKNLVPSLVALAPPGVSGIVASRPEGTDGRAALSTSHAILLARGRGLPLAMVPEHVTDGVVGGEWIVVDATEGEARVWVDPSEAFLDAAREKRERFLEARRAAEAAATLPLDHLGVAVRVTIGSLSEVVPEGADGVGLVRTELLFGASRGAPPSESELALALSALASQVGDKPLVVRLYDAGGDKPLVWLRAPASAPGARGIALLLAHEDVLAAQLGAITRVAGAHDLRVLIPLVRSPADIAAVRARAPGGVPIGAMIETPEAAAQAGVIAAAADFVSIGTNDLAASLGEDALGPRVLREIARIVEAARARGRDVTVCGELAGDPRGARILVGLGVQGLSVSPTKLGLVKAALRAVTREDCEAEARRAAADETREPGVV